MAFVAHPPLVTAVSNAGVLGIIGASPDPPPSLPVLVAEPLASPTGRVSLPRYGRARTGCGSGAGVGLVRDVQPVERIVTGMGGAYRLLSTS